MEFCDYFTLEQSAKRVYNKDQLVTWRESMAKMNEAITFQYFIEYTWESISRPYFKLYPSMIKALSNLNLNIKGNQVRWPTQLSKTHSPFLIKFPIDCRDTTPAPEGDILKSLLVYKFDTENEYHPLLFIYAHYGTVVRQDKVIPRTCSFSVRLDSDKTLESAFAELTTPEASAGILAEYNLRELLRYTVGTILLASEVDSELIMPEVLSKHELKFEQTGDVELIEKAKRNGKYGWSIGKQLEREVETNTHFRVPHFAIRHTGPNGSIPLLRPIKGSIVNRKKFVAQYEEEETNA